MREKCEKSEKFEICDNYRTCLSNIGSTLHGRDVKIYTEKLSQKPESGSQPQLLLGNWLMRLVLARQI